MKALIASLLAALSMNVAWAVPDRRGFAQFRLIHILKK